MSRDVLLQEHRGGLPTMTADGKHVLGPAPGRLVTGLPEDELRERCQLQYAHHYWSPASMPGEAG